MIGITRADGSGEDNPSVERLSDLYDELLVADQEHGDVAVIHDPTGWTISAHRDGRVILDRLGTRGAMARHMKPVSKDYVLRLWISLSSGEIDALLAEPWKPGYIKVGGHADYS